MAPAFMTPFFFNDTATTEIYTLSLHDALPISKSSQIPDAPIARIGCSRPSHPLKSPTTLTERAAGAQTRDRKSTRLNSSHANISYAVFCLKKKDSDWHIPSTASSFGAITSTPS